MRKILFFIIVVALLVQSVTAQTDSIDYFDQTPPDDSAVIFAPGIISKPGRDEYPCAFSSSGNEMVFGYKIGDERSFYHYIYDSTNEWVVYDSINFSGFAEMEFNFSPDGTKLFFSANTNNSKNKPHDIYYVTKIGSGWSTPVFIDSINSDGTEYYCTMSNNNRIYFTREGLGIYYSDFIDGHFTKSKSIGPLISTYHYCGHPFISPNEDYILFDCRESGYGSADLFVSYKVEGESWSVPRNLGEKINSSAWEGMPSVTPDGKFILFARGSSNARDIYWVSAKIIDDLRPQADITR